MTNESRRISSRSSNRNGIEFTECVTFFSLVWLLWRLFPGWRRRRHCSSFPGPSGGGAQPPRLRDHPLGGERFQLRGCHAGVNLPGAALLPQGRSRGGGGGRKGQGTDGTFRVGLRGVEAKVSIEISDIEWKFFCCCRFLRSAYSAVRRLLGLSAPLEESWNEQSSTSTLDSSSPSPSVNWPLALYGGLVLAAPYLMWRAAGGGEGGEASSTGEEWDPEEEESLVAEALYPFSPEAPEVEVALTAEGQRVLVAPRHRQPRLVTVL